MTNVNAKLDLLCIGRIAVDLYAEELGAGLHEARRFVRYLGGTSGNLAVGAARLGLRVGMAGAVGDDPMGDFLRERLVAEGIDTGALAVRRDRRTALAFLGMDSPEAVTLDFYREAAADTEIEPTPELLAKAAMARAVAVCGTHLADPATAERLAPVLDAARAGGAELVLDLDLRPQIWAGYDGGLHGTADRLARQASRFNLVVGNAEEWSLVAGVTDPAAAPDALRSVCGRAQVILKRGAHGAALQDDQGGWVEAPGRAVPVLNPVGAGDAFLGGYLAAHLTGQAPAAALAQGNACGAIVVARHGCSDAMPFGPELVAFAASGDPSHPDVLRAHRIGGRAARPHPVMALACDHRVPFADLARATGRGDGDIRRFKTLVVRAALDVAAAHRLPPAMLMDATFGAAELADLARRAAWVGRPVEVTRSRPLRFEAGEDLAAELRRWHPMQVAKCLVWHHPDDPAALIEEQIGQLRLLQAAAEAAGIEWMLEAVPPLGHGHDDGVLVRLVAGLYSCGLRPDYWKLPALETDMGWQSLREVIVAADPDCRGVVILGLDRPLADLEPGLVRGARHGICAGFAIGRSIFGAAAQEWFAGRTDDAGAVRQMAALYDRAVRAFLGGGIAISSAATMEAVKS
jgi:5-dehydro-2-deoxygluconokinase